MAKVLFEEIHGSIAPLTCKYSFVENMPAEVVKVLAFLLEVVCPRAWTQSHEMRPLSIPHWSNNALAATLCWFLSGSVMIVMGCNFPEMLLRMPMSITSLCGECYTCVDSSSDSNLMIGVLLLFLLLPSVLFT